MSRLSELIEEGKRNDVALLNQQGKSLIKLPLIWAVIIAVAAPQLVVVLIIAVLLEILDLEYDGRLLGQKAEERNEI